MAIVPVGADTLLACAGVAGLSKPAMLLSSRIAAAGSASFLRNTMCTPPQNRGEGR
jgi:hypothetical protein